jgi:hypothetical protein
MKHTYHEGKKFDIQLIQGQTAENRVGAILSGATKVEVKTEAYLWEKTGNIAIEYRCNGKPSGIAATEAEVWVHELRRDGEPVLTLVIPVERLKAICREAYRKGRYRRGGDGNRSEMVIVRITDLLAGN